MTHPAALGMERESEAMSGLFLPQGPWEGKSTAPASQEGGVLAPLSPGRKGPSPLAPCMHNLPAPHCSSLGAATSYHRVRQSLGS